MSSEQNKTTILQFYQFFDDRQIDQALELLAPDFVAHLAGVPEPLDREAFKQFGMTFYLAFSQRQHRFEHAFVEEDKVVTCGTFTAIRFGEFQGLPPTGLVENWESKAKPALAQSTAVLLSIPPQLHSYLLCGPPVLRQTKQVSAARFQSRRSLTNPLASGSTAQGSN